MAVDLKVAIGAHRQVEQPMAPEGSEHVVEKANAGLDIGRAGAVEVDRQLDVGFPRCARDACGPLAHVRPFLLVRHDFTQCGEELVVFFFGPYRYSQAVLEHRRMGEVAHEDAARIEGLPHLVGVIEF